MSWEDLAAGAAASAAAFNFDISAGPVAARWRERHGHLLGSDPAGCFIAERDGHVIGVAQAMIRERLWCLSLLTVHPGAQSAGAGRALMERALDYGADCEAGLIVGSNDPRALRLYARAGFRLHPTFAATGALDRRALPVADPRVREVGSSELDALADISREIRGAPHTSELEFARATGAQILALDDRGFAVAETVHAPWLLVARDEEAATALLWASLARSSANGPREVRWITEAQTWAIDVAIMAGLNVRADGALCVRGDPGRLHPFLPSPPFA